MSRDSAGVYHRPTGTTAVSGALITDEIFNDALDDVAAALTDSPRRAEVTAVAGANLTGGTAPSYTLAAPTITTITPDTAFTFRPHATNPGSALATTGDLTQNSATVANVVIPAGIAIGQTAASTTSGLPDKTTVLGFAVTDTTTGKGTITLSAAFTGTTTAAASLSLTPINPTLTLSAVPVGTTPGALAANTKRMIAPDGTGIRGGELDPLTRYGAFYDVGRDAFVILGLSRIAVSLTDGRPRSLYDKFGVADGSVLPIQTDPATGEQRMILPSATLQVGDVLYSGRTITSGFLPCDGATYLQSAQSALYSAIGHVFGTYTVVGATTYAATDPALAIEYNAGIGRYIIVTGSVSSQSYRALSSTNGGTWTSPVALFTSNFTTINFAGGASSPTATIFVVRLSDGAGSNIAYAYRTTDGAAYSAVTLNLANPGSIAYGAGMFVAVAAGASVSAISTSPDGVTWTARTLSALVTNARVAFANGTFVVVGDGGVVLRSADGIAWTQPTVTGLPSTLNTKLIGASGTFVLGQNNSTLYYTSTDGITWKRRQAAVSVTPMCSMGGGWYFYNSQTTLVVTFDFINHNAITLNSATALGAASFSSAVVCAVNLGAPLNLALSYDRTTTFQVPNIPFVPAAYIKSA